MGLGFMDLELNGPYANGWNGQLLSADPYGDNPYIADLNAHYPGVSRLASNRQDAPTLFAGGDLPPFMASGLKPDLLKSLPFTMRHAAASETSAQRLLEWVEQVGLDRETRARQTLDHPGLQAYRDRVNAWVAGINPDGLGSAPSGALPAGILTGRREQVAR